MRLVSVNATEEAQMRQMNRRTVNPPNQVGGGSDMYVNELWALMHFYKGAFGSVLGNGKAMVGVVLLLVTDCRRSE